MKIVGVLVAMIVTGGGHVIIGRAHRAFLWWIVGIASIVALIAAACASARAALFALAAVITIHLLSILDAALVERRSENVPDSAKLVLLLPAMFLIAPFLLVMSRFLVLEPYRIPSSAMLPTLEVGDVVFANRVTYMLRSPARGDVIVFRFPHDRRKTYIKRVVGIEGDIIDIRDDVLYVNGNPVTITSRGQIEVTDTGCYPLTVSRIEETLDGATYDTIQAIAGVPENSSFVVPEGDFFVLGDNRDNSADSRTGFTVPLGDVKSHARWVLLSWDSCMRSFRADRTGKQVR